MRIQSVEAWKLNVPLKGTFKAGRHVLARLEAVAVRIRTASGLEGAGNVDPVAGYSKLTPLETYRVLDRQFRPALLGRDAASIRGIVYEMEKIAPQACEAMAAVEMALMDLNGKALGVPAHRLLGGAIRDTLRFNGWIGVVPPEEAERMARDYAQRGFSSLKIKVGGTVEPDRDRVAAVRHGAPDMAIRVDGNESYGTPAAIRLAREIARFGITLFEQPIPRADLEGMRTLRRAIDIPLMADEALYDLDSLVAIIRREAADIVKVKVMKQGGMQRTLSAIDMAGAAGMRCVIGHGFGQTLHTLAEMHVAAVSNNIFEEIECVGAHHLAGDIVKHPVLPLGSSCPVPNAPGLGATLDESALRQYLDQAA